MCVPCLDYLDLRLLGGSLSVGLLLPTAEQQDDQPLARLQRVAGAGTVRIRPELEQVPGLQGAPGLGSGSG